MKNPARLINAIPPVRDPLVHSTLQRGLLLLGLSLGFAFLSTVRAVSPPPDGGYPNETTAEGENALFSLTTGFWNTAVGFKALYSTTTGISNVAVGHLALSNNTTGSANTALGTGSLLSNTTGTTNTAIGAGALDVNTIGGSNTAVGSGALSANTTGGSNTAMGESALGGNTSGVGNTAVGEFSMASNTTGLLNTAIGDSGLISNSTGANNTAIGSSALSNNTSGNSNIAVGDSAGSALTTGKNNIDIGNAGTAGESAKIRIGNKAHKNTYVAGISGVTVAGGVGVIIDSTGHLGTVTSSARYKEAIQPMNASSEAILSLRPVKFRYKKALDAQGIPQFGLVAEDVAKVNPDLVARDEEGKPYTVRYEAVNAMLLNEFLKEHRKGQQQDRKIEELEATVTHLEATLKAQAAQIQKVSDQLARQAPAPRVVANE